MADGGIKVTDDVSMKCSYCDNKEQTMKLCTRCRAIIYCSRECQVKDWPNHKQKCCKTSSQRSTAGTQESFTKENILREREKQLVKEENKRSSTVISDDVKELDFEQGNNNTREQVLASKCTTVSTPSKQDIRYSQIAKREDSVSDRGKACKLLSSQKEMDVLAKQKGCDSSVNDILCKELAPSALDKSIAGTKSTLQTNEDSITIFIKHNKEKKKLEIVMNSEDRNSTFQQISDFVKIPVEKLKLIHKGKMVMPESIHTFLNHRALFLAFGEVCECEDGLDKSDIDVLMKQLNVERNVAVKALRQTGTLLDAIFDIGNNL